MSENKRRAFTKAERKRVYEKCNGRCAYCGCRIALDEMQVDHVIPLHSEMGTNDFENLMPACRSCNHYKSTMSIEKFREMLEGIPGRLIRDSCIFKIGLRFGTVLYRRQHIKFYYERMGKNE